MTDKTYLAAQLRRLSRCKDHYTYQIRSDDGSHTNWMNLSQAELEKVSKLLLDPPANGLQVEEHPDTRAMKAIAQVLSGKDWTATRWTRWRGSSETTATRSWTATRTTTT